MTNVKSSQQELKIQLSEGVKELKELKTFAIADMTSKVVCIVLTPARRASEAISPLLLTTKSKCETTYRGSIGLRNRLYRVLKQVVSEPDTDCFKMGYGF